MIREISIDEVKKVIHNKSYCDICGNEISSSIDPEKPEFQGIRSINVDQSFNMTIDTCSGCQSKILRHIRGIAKNQA